MKEQILLDLPFASKDIEDLAGLPSGYLQNDFGQLSVMPKLGEGPSLQLEPQHV